jgi:hypothetical protein
MTDIVERLREGLDIGVPTPIGEQCRDAADEIESLRQQLAELEDDEQKAVERCVIAEQKLAQCQAREKVLRDDMKLASIQYMGCGGNLLPGEIIDAMNSILNHTLVLSSDSTALDQAIRQAKREALLEAINRISRMKGQPPDDWHQGYAGGCIDNEQILRRMAKELE